jgi:hypothetical protein
LSKPARDLSYEVKKTVRTGVIDIWNLGHEFEARVYKKGCRGAYCREEVESMLMVHRRM